MTWLVNAIGWIVDFFLSKKSRFLALLPLKASVTAMFVVVGGLYISSILMFVYFLVSIFNTLFSLVRSINNLSSSVTSSGGSAYGISLSDLWNVFLGILNATGLADAIMSATALLVTLLSGYFAFAITKMIAEKMMAFLSGVTDIVRMYDA